MALSTFQFTLIMATLITIQLSVIAGLVWIRNSAIRYVSLACRCLSLCQTFVSFRLAPCNQPKVVCSTTPLSESPSASRS
jgi:hypothetical protein